MKTYLLFFLLFIGSSGLAQDLTGIWRGSFVSGDKRLNDMFNFEDRYKYEVQIDNRGKAFKGVTYSYKTTVFYGKASAKGTLNDRTGKVILEELQLLELKMSPGSEACWMICFLQYTKNGEEEFLEGKYSSYRENDSSFCGRGTVYLRKVPVSDFYKEPFLVKREKEKALELQKQKELAKTNAQKPPVKPPVEPPLVKKTKPQPKKISPTQKTTDPKSTTVTAKVDTDKKLPVIKNAKPAITPPILKERQNEVVQTINVQTDEITVDIYDNGSIDHDTVSVYLDKKLVLSKQMLKAVPLTLKIKMENTDDYHELVMVAENLGEIPPNTSLMVVHAGDKRYEVRITSTEQKNAMVIFKYQKPKLPVP
jgi:archaellum component FlaF (FlaF/FlaG flagellin family)